MRAWGVTMTGVLLWAFTITILALSGSLAQSAAAAPAAIEPHDIVLTAASFGKMDAAKGR